MKKELGQYFTTNADLLFKLKSFVKNTSGEILEPSFGRGDIIKAVSDFNRKITGIEIDTNIKPLDDLELKAELIYTDFLTWECDTKFSTIVGNPPYVKHKRGNLYIDFIDTCLDYLDSSGELVFIIPTEFFKSSCAVNVKQKMMVSGSFTDIYHPNNENLFKNATQDVCIIRYQKGIWNKTVNYNDKQMYIKYINGNVYFNIFEHGVSLESIFEIKVGIVSGMDSVFKNNLGDLKVLTANGEFNYVYKNTALIQDFKPSLLKRKIRHFDETNWFEWGAMRNKKFMETNFGEKCIYCRILTRKPDPFFISTVCYFDGSLICLKPKDKSINLIDICDYLNSEEFLNNFNYSGRYKFGQKSLCDALIIGNLTT